MEYSESLEMYLETILQLSKTDIKVHVVDVARKLNISKPSVSKAIHVLKKEGLLNHEPYQSITLTEKGRLISEKVQKRHRVITRFLIHTLQLDLTTAEKDACRMEHILSPETLEAMIEFNEERQAQPKKAEEKPGKAL